MSVRTYRDGKFGPETSKAAGVDSDPDVPYADIGRSALHRCDRCGAQAYVAAMKPEAMVLLLCGHHGRKHVGSLQEQGWFVIDRTEYLYEDVNNE